MDEPVSLEQAAERLLEDESFRSALTDDEAQVLFDWALAELDAASARGEPLASVLARVRATGRQVNNLVAARADLDPAAFAARLRGLAGLPQPRLPGTWRCWFGQHDAVDTLVTHLPQLDGPALVSALLALVAPTTPTEAT